jgi:hypothetical protein
VESRKGFAICWLQQWQQGSFGKYPAASAVPSGKYATTLSAANKPAGAAAGYLAMAAFALRFWFFIE